MEDIWQIIPIESKKSTTNCIMPKHLLNAVVSRAGPNEIQLPLLFKVTNPVNNEYAICAAENYFETQENENIAMLSPIVIKYLKINELAEISIINKSPDLIPKKAKYIYLEPHDEMFYQIKDPVKILEKCLKRYFIIGCNYLIPLNHSNGYFNIKVVRLTDEYKKDMKFANINNADVNVEFLPIPEQYKKKECKVIRKKQISNEIKSQPHNSSTYDPNKKWKPFCGMGYVLLTGNKVNGVSQDDDKID